MASTIVTHTDMMTTDNAIAVYDKEQVMMIIIMITKNTHFVVLVCMRK